MCPWSLQVAEKLFMTGIVNRWTIQPKSNRITSLLRLRRSRTFDNMLSTSLLLLLLLACRTGHCRNGIHDLFLIFATRKKSRNPKILRKIFDTILYLFWNDYNSSIVSKATISVVSKSPTGMDWTTVMVAGAQACGGAEGVCRR